MTSAARMLRCQNVRNTRKHEIFQSRHKEKKSSDLRDLKIIIFPTQHR
jgi:hypothetical protein